MVEAAETGSIVSSGHYVPEGDIDQYLTAVYYQLKFYLRSWRFIGLMLFTIALTGGIMAYQLHLGIDHLKTNSPTVSDFLSSGLGEMSTEVVLIAAFFGGDAISTDLGTSTGYYMLTLPVRRAVLMMGRYTAAFLVGVGVAAAYYAIEAAGAFYVYGTLPVELISSVGLGLLYLLACLALAFFLSSLFRSPSVSIVIILLVMLIGFPAVTAILSDLGGYEPWWSLSYAGDVIGGVLSTNFQHVSTLTEGKGARAITIYLFSPYVWEGVVIMIAYLAVFLFLSFFIYEYRELKG
jgi:ABC-2 type transport system permease protein